MWGMQRYVRRGSVVGLIAVSLTALVGAVAVSFDVGRVVAAAQRTQDVADAAALAGMNSFPSENYTAANQRVADDISANNVSSGLTVTSASGETTFFTAGASVPGYGALGAYDEAVTVSTHADVHFYFAPALGVSNSTVTRRATCVTAAASGASICPIWVSETTPYLYGQEQSLLMSDGPHYPGIPGSFGFLQPTSGSNDFYTLLSGYNVSSAMLAANYVTLNQILYAETGLKTGQWVQSLETDATSRLSRGSWAPWAADTWTNYHKDNPRLMVIPICQYLGGTGSGAQFKVLKFGVFWLKAVTNKAITGIFIKYTLPGSGHSYDGVGGFSGIWTTFLVH